MKTTETNKKFAKFLGYDTSDEEVVRKNLNFHSDWNLLMAVLFKIDGIELINQTFTIDIYRDAVVINSYENGNSRYTIYVDNFGGRFNNLYEACSEFVDWYNAQAHEENY